MQNLSFWLKGVRFYIAIGLVLVSLETWWWTATAYSGSRLAAIRLQEIYAWAALACLALAVAIGPAYKVFPALPARPLMRDARRLIGIGAAWFASLHVAIAYIVLFGLPNPFSLPPAYGRAFVVGLLALLILLALAFTSFDRALKGMGKWWFRLHRLIYAAVALSLLHAFMVGSHSSSWSALIGLSLVTAAILTLHIYLAFVRADRPTIWQLLTIVITAFVLLAIFNYGYAQRLGYNPLEGKHSQEEP